VSPNKPKGKTGAHLKSAWPLLQELASEGDDRATALTGELIKQLRGLVPARQVSSTA
jgi:hypothetical protein